MDYFEKVFAIRWLGYVCIVFQAIYIAYHKKSLPLMLGFFLFLVEVLRASVVLFTFPGWVLSAMSASYIFMEGNYFSFFSMDVIKCP